MRLAQVTGSAGWAGGERQLMDLLDGLGPGYRLSVVCPEDGPLVARLKERGVPVRVAALSPLGSPFAVSRLAEALRGLEPELVQSHGARSNFHARLACRRLGLPQVSTVHNSLRDYPLPAWRRAAYAALDRWTAPLSRAVVCVSRSLGRELAEREGLGEGLVRVVPNGVDARRFDPARADRERARAALGVPEGAWLVGAAGRMTEQKGFDLLLEAWGTVRRERPGARLALAGDGPLRGELERRAAAFGGEVRFTGLLEDMPAFYAALDAFVLPSRSEGLPYALLEALAMERPAVAAGVNGVPELMEGEPGLVPPEDSAALAGALLALAADPAAAERGRRGRERVLRDYSLDSMLEGWRRVYREALG